jgi:membrane-bound lytic murein transglycosylase D
MLSPIFQQLTKTLAALGETADMRKSITSLIVLALLAAILTTGCSSIVRQGPGIKSADQPRGESTVNPEDKSNDTVLSDPERKAVDDPVYLAAAEELTLAEEYYTYGVLANTGEKWLEAQYNFERAIEILSNLDTEIQPETQLGQRYNDLLESLRTEYKLTLLYLATIPGDASSSAFVDRFIEIDDFTNLRGSKVETDVDKEEPYDIPIVVNKKVENCIVYFQTIARDFFQQSLTRSGKFKQLWTEILAEEGVPKDIFWLALVESGFKTNAYSWAKAMGPWQFISSTGRIYGLQRDWWYDERRDFVKATRAAARHLKDLHDRYGDWYLAVAAYNSGAGRIDREIKRSGGKDYWRMTRLPRETRDYVPLFLAATIIARNPQKYGFEPYFDQPLSYETITIDKCIDLKEVASSIGTSVDYLVELNPEILRKITPPGMKSYHLRIPVNSSEKFWAVYDSFDKPHAAGLQKHRINRGETLSTIARRYGTTVNAICAANNISTKTRIYAGSYLMVPVSSGSGGGGYASSSGRYASMKSSDGKYKVKRGDSLWKIAEANNTTVNSLRVLNGLGAYSHIYPGQVLKVNSGSSSTPSKVFTYKVKRGDSLAKIANRYGTTVKQLASVNGINTLDYLRIGQLINVPSKRGSGGSGASQSGTSLVVYIVKAGDTLWDIARSFGTTVDEIVYLNQLRSKRLRVGDKLKVRTS